jgi:guanylate kinase
MGKVIIFVGGSCSGKSTAEDILIAKYNAKRIVQWCTRQIRDTEIDGKHYQFCTPEEFKQKQCLNVIKISDEWYYGMDPSIINEIQESKDIYTYATINIKYAESFATILRRNDISFSVVAFDIDKDIRHTMLHERGLAEEEIEERLAREDKYNIDEFLKYTIIPTLIYKTFSNNIGDELLPKLNITLPME